MQWTGCKTEQRGHFTADWAEGTAITGSVGDPQIHAKPAALLPMAHRADLTKQKDI